MKFKLPSLHLGLLKDLKSPEDDSRKFIHVIGGHAILQNEIIIIVDLREYIKHECDITDQEELDQLTSIINWMEGKSFSNEFWKELTKENHTTMTPDGFEIEYLSYNKVLVYEAIDTNPLLMAQVINDNIGAIPVTVDRIGIKSSVLTTLTSMFKTEMKSDNFVFDFCGKTNPIKFTAQRKTYIFGLLPTDYNSTTEFTAFLNVNDFRDTIIEFINRE